jgi:antibiotic biosynthesis monooxygenase (ABM) superfamily enzyme
MAIHVAITRRVRPGRETEFLQGLREFFQVSYSHSGVYGANLIVPPPGSSSRDYGILRTFSDEAERDAFYQSPSYKYWAERARSLTEGEPQYRQLHGLEAGFREAVTPPPRWKMAVVTFVGVYLVTTLLISVVEPVIRPLPFLLHNAIFNALVVGLLTWLVMPVVTRMARRWLDVGS